MIRVSTTMNALCVIFLSSAVGHGAFTYSIDDAAAWQATVPEVVTFPAPNAPLDNIASDSQSAATSDGTLTYTIFNRDTSLAVDNAELLSQAGSSLGTATGLIADLFHDTNGTLDTETTVEQDGASLTVPGYDNTNTTGKNTTGGGKSSRNAAYFTFSQPIVGFNVDLLDFETTTDQEGLLVFGLSGDIIDSQDFTFPFDDGDGIVHNVGITSSGGMVFDSVMFVLGDDADANLSDGYGASQNWAAANIVAAVPEPSSFMFIGLLTVVGVGIRKYRRHLMAC